MKFHISKWLKCLCLLTICIFMSSGCRFLPNPKKYFSKDFNAAGALPLQKIFAPIETGTIRLRSDEIWYRKDFSGDKTTALWGLITYTDY